MLFQTPIFFFFLALLLPIYALTRGSRARQIVLIVFSYWFYAQWNWRYLALLLLSSFIDFYAALKIFGHDKKDAAERDKLARRLYLIVSLSLNLGLLAVFKYGRFLLSNLGFDGSFLPEEIPPGISFYTFQTMSYTIDVYLRRTPPERSPIEYALYVAFFPQLVAGPILRAEEFLPQTRPMPQLRLVNIAEGFQRFMLGMFKKVVLADQVGLYVNAVFLTPGREDAVHLWAAAYGFALLIYCDFSAYSDMAIGLAHAFGFKVPENFNAPYLARSITEFWRRWHMTLSRWLRDYLYVPLGGNRNGAARTYRNLMITMLLGGLWHGANWTFVLWGAWHGVLLAIERLCGVRADATAERGFTFGRLVGIFVTFHLVCLSWVVFRANNVETAGLYLSRMFTEFDVAQVLEFGRQLLFGWQPSGPSAAAFWTKAVLALIVCQWLVRRFDLKRTLWDRLPALAQGIVLALVCLACSVCVVDEVKFIYFQF